MAMSIWVDVGNGEKSRMTLAQAGQWAAGVTAAERGDVRDAVAAFDAIGTPWVAGVANARKAAMERLSQQTVDPFDSMIKEAALAQLGRRSNSRQKSFVNGPRGVEGPLSNAIFSGGTSLLGS